MNRKPAALFLMALLFLMSACTTLPTVKSDASNPIKTIAILPLQNNTNDLDGPVVVRTLLAARLDGHFYQVKPLQEVDTLLRDQMGVTLGSQLDMVTTAQLCEKINADAIILGSLDDFNHKITGIYNNKRVRLRLKLDSCKTGTTVWKNGIGVKREVYAGDSLLKNVPILGVAITTAGVASAVISSLSDKADTDLPRYRNEEIKAPWQDISEDNSSAELNLLFGLGQKVAGKALSSPLLSESEVAVEILLRGYYDDGNDLIPFEPRLPPGPLAAQVTTASTVAR